LRVGEALERAPAAEPVRVLAALAHHFAVAAPVGGAGRAVEYNLRAADAAMSALAFEEAAARVSTALELGIADEAERGRSLLLLGTACEHVARPREALAAFREAAALGRARGDPELLAHAAIGFE